MINIKVIKASSLKKAAVFVVIAAVIIFFIKYSPTKGSVQVPGQTVKISSGNDIYCIMMKKTMPMLETVSDESSSNYDSQFIAFTIFNYLTNIDISNPKTYLASEIPLLGLVDIVSFSGSVNGASSTASNSETNQEVYPQQQDDKSSNFQDMPVVNANIDYSMPGVIIFHTHTSESFTPTPQYNYVSEGDFETSDKNLSVCRLGEEIKKYLETYYGIAVIHDTTFHDQPSRNGSYERAKPTMERLLKQYPDVKLIIDLHRDGVDEDQKDIVTANIRNEQAARIMFVIGKSNPHWQENYYLASKLQQKMEELYPGLSRTKAFYIQPNLIYNQDITNKALLIELGAQRNTLEEAIVSSKMLARSIGELLKED